MNAKRTAAVLAVAFAAAALRPAVVRAAQDSTPFVTFFKHLKESLSQSAVAAERKKGRGGSVAAVRGANQSSPLADPDRTTLKGDAASARLKRQAAEDLEFEKAVDLVLAGKTAEGAKALEVFKAKHPKSMSVRRVDEALEQLKAMQASAAPAAKAPEKAEAAKGEKAEAPAAKP